MLFVSVMFLVSQKSSSFVSLGFIILLDQD